MRGYSLSTDVGDPASGSCPVGELPCVSPQIKAPQDADVWQRAVPGRNSTGVVLKAVLLGAQTWS